MRGKAHSDEVRAEVMAALLSGLGVNETARRYNLPPKTVSRIKAELLPEQLTQVDTEKRERIDTLLLDNLAANIRAQKRIAEIVSVPDYILKHGPGPVAELYAALADKAIRLLEAASDAGIDGDAPGE